MEHLRALKKNYSIHGIRGSQIGDSVAALSVLNYLKLILPDSYVTWQVARKHIQAVPIFYNHPFIDRLAISDGNEGYGIKDIEMVKNSNFSISSK
jgi:ADP-heptose:LPS heptosyltransferase